MDDDEFDRVVDVMMTVIFLTAVGCTFFLAVTYIREFV